MIELIEEIGRKTTNMFGYLSKGLCGNYAIALGRFLKAYNPDLKVSFININNMSHTLLSVVDNNNRACYIIDGNDIYRSEWELFADIWVYEELDYVHDEKEEIEKIKYRQIAGQEIKGDILTGFIVSRFGSCKMLNNEKLAECILKYKMWVKKGRNDINHKEHLSYMEDEQI